MNTRYSKVISLLLALIMLFSTLSATTAFAAVDYYSNLKATDATVTLDGTNDGEVIVSLVGTADMNIYAIQGDWETKDSTGKLALSNITTDVSNVSFTGMSYADVPTGKVLWSDGTFSAPAVIKDGTKFLNATYKVAADTPSGTYTVRFRTEVLTATDYNSYTTETYYTAKITVTNNGGGGSSDSYYDKLEATNASVALDGTNDGEVTVSLVGTADMNVYAIQGDWDTKDSTGKLALSNITTDVSNVSFTGMSYADVPTGKVLWSDGTFSAPAVIKDGTKFLNATYKVAADTPAGTYTVRFRTEVLTATDYNSYTTETYYTAKITVTRPAAHVCSNGTKQAGQDATCTVDGWKDYYTCSCGEFYEEAACTTLIPDLAAWKAGDGKIAASHDYGTLVDEDPGKHTATEVKDGMNAHYFCDTCDTYFDSSKNPTTKAALTIKNQHSYTTQYGYKEYDGHADTCVCGAHNTVVGHTPDIPAPTETQDQKCSVCGYVIATKIDHIHQNNLTPVTKLSATCTEDGYEAHYKCSCGKYFEDASASVAIPDIAAWKAGDGKIAAEGHKYTEQKKDAAHLKTEATKCTEFDVYWYYCSVCDANAKNDPNATDKFWTSTDAGEHKFDEKLTDAAHLVAGTGANCQDAKKYYYDCAYCATKGTTTWTSDSFGDHSFIEKIADAAHLVAGTGANCQDAKEYYYDCEHCATIGTTSWVSTEMGDHSFTEKIADVAHLVAGTGTNCQDAKEYYYDCEHCATIGTTIWVSTTMGDHEIDMTQWGYKDKATGHAHKCKFCDEHDAVQPHTPNMADPGEYEDKICTTCLLVLEPATGHIHQNKWTAVGMLKATCTTDGHKAYYECTCGKYFEDATATVEISDITAWLAGAGKIPATGHDYTVQLQDADHIKTTATKCTEFNTYWYACSVCGANAKNDPNATDKFWTSTIAGDHSFTEQKMDAAHLVAGTGANCQDAKKYYYDCAYCDEIGTTSWVSTEMGDHNFNEKIADAEHLVPGTGANCQDAKEYYYDCEHCVEIGTTTWASTEVGNHEFETTQWGYKDVATGHAHKCKFCDEHDAVQPHTPNMDAPTEDDDKICTVCLIVLQPATGHICQSHLTKVPANGASCTVDGNIEYYECSCGKYYTDATAAVEITDKESVVIKASHNYGTLIEEDPAVHTPTELKAGMKAHYFCDKCSTYFTADKVATTESELVIPAPVHEYNTVNGYKEADGHADTCSCGAHNTVVPHTPDREAATENDPIKCSVCGYEIAPALGHIHKNNLTKVPAETADCEKDGNIEYYICSCGKYYTDATASVEITDKDSVVIKGGHKFGELVQEEPAVHTATEKKDGMKAHYFCDECDTYFTADKVATTKDALVIANAHSHGTEWKSDKDNHWNECACGDKANSAAHKDENSDGKCDVCEYNVGTPGGSTGDDKPSDNPQTGDNSNMILWISLLMLSALGIVATTVIGKKKYSVK